MRRILGGAVAAVLALALAAGCSSESDDGVLTPVDNDGDNGGDNGEEREDDPLGGEAQAYADAIALAGQFDDPDDDSEVLLSDEASACYGEAYVETVGVERLAEKVTPEEIESDPGKDAAEWGVEVSKDEGVEIFRSLIDCSPGVLQEFGEGVAGSLGEGELDLELDAECLASVDPAEIEGFMGGSIAGGDNFIPSEEEATALVDWMMGCGDMSSALLEPFADVPGFSDGAIECIAAGFDDEMVREVLIISISGGGEAEVEASEAGAALLDLVTECMGA